MKKDVLEKAKALERDIDYYNKIAYAMSFPWQKFKLTGRQASIGAASANVGLEVTLSDKQLAEIIRDYCNSKKAELQAELDML